MQRRSLLGDVAESINRRQRYKLKIAEDQRKTASMQRSTSRLYNEALKRSRVEERVSPLSQIREIESMVMVLRGAVLAKANSKLSCQTGTVQVRNLKHGKGMQYPIVIT